MQNLGTGLKLVSEGERGLHVTTIIQGLLTNTGPWPICFARKNLKLLRMCSGGVALWRIATTSRREDKQFELHQVSKNMKVFFI
jgi:hypothetical protein